MTALQRLLLIPGLAPLVLLALVAGLNWRQNQSLRFLTWQSPPLPLGAWMAMAAGGGAALSGLAGLALAPSVRPLQREVHRSFNRPFPNSPFDARDDAVWPEPDQPPKREPRVNAPPAWPERDIRDPSPTVAVPYRVIQRGEQLAKTPAHGGATATKAEPAPHQDDWGDGLGDDW